jgi:hypothetical protein
VRNSPTQNSKEPYNAAGQHARIIGGAAFTHFITRGLGLPIEELPSDVFPVDGEVGHIAQHALSLYTALLEANNPTLKFIQALSNYSPLLMVEQG